MSLECLVGIDVGTSSTRVTFYSADGRLLAEGRASHQISHPRPGWAEEDAEDWWIAVCAASRAALAAFPFPPESIKGIAITSMRQTFVCVDGNVRPLYPGILWYDTRHAAQVDWAQAHIGSQTIYRITGSPPGRRAIYKVMWLKEHEPEVYQATAHILFVPDFILHRLTGQLVTTPGVACASGCLDVKARFRWATSLIEQCGVDPDKWLGDIRPAGEIAGLVTAEAAGETGFPVGTPVVLAAGDQACGNLGIGVCQPGSLGINGGTSCALQTPSERLPVDEAMSFFVDFSPAGYYVAENGITSGTGALTEWFRREFGQPESRQAESEGELWDRLYDLASEAPPGNLGLMLVPYLRGANGPLWDPRARGILVGLMTDHGRAHLMRALLEGLAYESRRIVENMEKGTGVPIVSVRTYGGASQNDVWNGIFADVLGRPVTVTLDPAPVSLGAAITAGYGVGLYRNPVDAARQMVRVRKVYEPSPERASLYEDLYHGAYVHLYERVGELTAYISRRTTHMARPEAEGEAQRDLPLP
ncbi:MAG: xylulokinase [Anaerolineae bacterium]